jgi:hypothetical protein
MTDHTWVDSAYTIAAFVVVFLLIYVMQKVEDDRWSKTDSLWLQWVRRAAFVTTAILLLYSIFSEDWRLTSLILVSASGAILFINAIALALRAPPKNKGKMRHAPHGFSYVVARVAHYFSAHR